MRRRFKNIRNNIISAGAEKSYTVFNSRLWQTVLTKPRDKLLIARFNLLSTRIIYILHRAARSKLKRQLNGVLKVTRRDFSICLN